MSSRSGTALRRNRGIRSTLTVAAAVAVSAALLAPGPQAQASTAATAPTAAKTAVATVATTYHGTMRKDFTARIAPTVYAPFAGLLKEGTTVNLQCKTYGDSVHGNYLWYKITTAKWVTAYYVNVSGATPPFCGNGHLYSGRATTGLNVRNGPNTQDTIVGSVNGQFNNIVCKVASQNIDGNSLWYQRTGGTAGSGGRWVSARFVANVGSAPPYC